MSAKPRMGDDFSMYSYRAALEAEQQRAKIPKDVLALLGGRVLGIVERGRKDMCRGGSGKRSERGINVIMKKSNRGIRNGYWVFGWYIKKIS